MSVVVRRDIVAAFVVASLASSFAAPSAAARDLMHAPARDQAKVVMRGQRFTPARVEITAGDSVRFELESGAPHNIAFEPDSIPAGALTPLARALGAAPTLLFSPYMLVVPGDTYVLATAGLPPGRYAFFCAPHVGGGMRGELIVRAAH